VRTSIASSHPRMLTFGYGIFDKTSGRKLATGETKHVFCDRQHRPVKLPLKHRAVFGIMS
jgi:acyl-CoA thioesterase FadM